MDKTRQDGNRATQDTVRIRYSPIGSAMTSDGNLIKLRAIIRMFALGLSDVAKAGCVSRPYVSRVLGGGLRPSPRFLRCLEANLGRLVEARHGQVFAVEVTPTEEAEKVLAVGRTS